MSRQIFHLCPFFFSTVHRGGRTGHPGRHLPPPGPELFQDVRHHFRGPRERGEEVCLPELLGNHHPDPRGSGHGPRGRQGPCPAAKVRLRTGEHSKKYY